MRFKQGKGDPAGFKEFMHQENIRPGMIVIRVSSCSCFLSSEREIFRQYLSLLNRFSFSTTEGPEK